MYDNTISLPKYSIKFNNNEKFIEINDVTSSSQSFNYECLLKIGITDNFLDNY